jgi:hypothetical protein
VIAWCDVVLARNVAAPALDAQMHSDWSMRALHRVVEVEVRIGNPTASRVAGGLTPGPEGVGGGLRSDREGASGQPPERGAR